MEINNTFYLSSYHPEKRESTLDGMNSIHFQELVSKSLSHLQKTGSESLQKLYKTRSISMMFLDKISRLIGKYHPDSLEAQKFVGSPNSYASMELIRHLSNLLKHADLSENTVRNLKKWIDAEQNCLPVSLIFDAWRLSLVGKKDLPDDELEIFSSAISSEMKSMKPGDRFKLPAGSLMHATRLETIKNEDGTFDLIHFNTGIGTSFLNGNFSTACKYPSISSAKLEDPKFWKQFVEAQLQPSMDCMNDFLKAQNLGKSPIDINIWLKKQHQESGSCTFHAVDAEFKHSFITSFSKLEEGWTAYKQCKSLMLSEEVKKGSSSLESNFQRMLFAKEKIRKRYLDWIGILDNPEKFIAMKTAYMDALISLGSYSKMECSALTENLPPLMALNLLDKLLNNCLNYASCNQLTQIRNTLGLATTFNGVNHIGHKQIKWLESSHQILQDMIHAKQTPLDPEPLSKFLTEYVLRESPLLADPILYRLKKENIISENFMWDRAVVVEHIINGNASALELAGSDDALMDACYLLTSSYIKTNIEKVIKLASNISDNTKKGITLMGATLASLKLNHIAEAKHMVLLIPEGNEKRVALLQISYWLVNAGRNIEAITFAGKIAESPEKRAALLNIVNAQLKCGDIEGAKILVNLIHKDPEKGIALHNLSAALIMEGRFEDEI